MQGSGPLIGSSIMPASIMQILLPGAEEKRWPLFQATCGSSRELPEAGGSCRWSTETWPFMWAIPRPPALHICFFRSCLQSSSCRACRLKSVATESTFVLRRLSVLSSAASRSPWRLLCRCSTLEEATGHRPLVQSATLTGAAAAGAAAWAAARPSSGWLGHSGVSRELRGAAE